MFDFPGSDCVVRFPCILGGHVGPRWSEMCLIFPASECVVRFACILVVKLDSYSRKCV